MTVQSLEQSYTWPPPSLSFSIVVFVRYHGHEINELFQSNGHLLIVTHVGGYHNRLLIYFDFKAMSAPCPNYWTMKVNIEVEVNLWPTVCRPVCLGVRRPSVAHDQNFFRSDDCGFLDVGYPLWREDGSVIYSCSCFWAFPEQSLLGWSPTELRPYFPVSFETPPTWRARFPYVYPPGRR
jgi:hypothetical protein